mgnify:CR=1 FL=1
MIKIDNIRIRIRAIWVSRLKGYKIYKYCYASYWHLRIKGKRYSNDKRELYFSARPNPGAGIGHQMANWIAGYWFAQKFGLKFAHIPFSSDKWETFLGFYQNEAKFSDLKKKGYRVKRIQLFDENNKEEVKRIKRIIDAYSGTKTIFLAEQDQFYYDQYGVMDELRKKFYSNQERVKDDLIYTFETFNIAVHVRRGDIVQNPGEDNPNLTMRYQSNEYFVNAIKVALKFLNLKKNFQIYLFSQGKPEDYQEFMQFKNLHFCLDMGAQESFLHMVYADALITSKSSFSYNPALLNRGIKFCPANFWHGYPSSKDWILLDDKGMRILE